MKKVEKLNIFFFLVGLIQSVKLDYKTMDDYV